MAWFGKHIRNESVDQFSLWGSLSAQDAGGDESYVSISNEVTSVSEECTVSQSPAIPALAGKAAKSDSQNGPSWHVESRSMEGAAFWLGLDHSTSSRSLTSWVVFMLLGVLFPLVLLGCTNVYK